MFYSPQILQDTHPSVNPHYQVLDVQYMTANNITKDSYKYKTQLATEPYNNAHDLAFESIFLRINHVKTMVTDLP